MGYSMDLRVDIIRSNEKKLFPILQLGVCATSAKRSFERKFMARSEAIQ